MSKAEQNSRSKRSFKTTRWSLVLSASAGGADALEELCRMYWPPIYWHLRRSGKSAADAQDLTQEFFARLLEKGALEAADQMRGRFRTFLLTSLRRFVINQWRMGRAKKRGGGLKAISFDFQEVEKQVSAIAIRDLTPDQMFIRQWSLTVLNAGFEALRLEQASRGKLEMFEQLTPLLVCDDSAPTYAELALRLKTTPDALRVRVGRLRSRLRKLVRQEIGKTVTNPTEIDDEVRHMFASIKSPPR